MSPRAVGGLTYVQASKEDDVTDQVMTPPTPITVGDCDMVRLEHVLDTDSAGRA